MKLNEILDPLIEGSFDDMVNQLGNVPKKGPGRWPKSDEKKTTGSNYSGERQHERDYYGNNVGTPVKRKKSLDQLKGPGPSRIKKVKE